MRGFIISYHCKSHQIVSDEKKLDTMTLTAKTRYLSLGYCVNSTLKLRKTKHPLDILVNALASCKFWMI